ncbi:hypothetical protein IQ225_13230 [Synechocystis salina LEGE 06155]|nr:hypothetical protein [Synechocystis salina LEGE 06155]
MTQSSHVSHCSLVYAQNCPLATAKLFSEADLGMMKRLENDYYDKS